MPENKQISLFDKEPEIGRAMKIGPNEYVTSDGGQIYLCDADLSVERREHYHIEIQACKNAEDKPVRIYETTIYGTIRELQYKFFEHVLRIRENYDAIYVYAKRYAFELMSYYGPYREETE